MYRRTLFNTPVITPLFRSIARVGLRILGWEVKGELPQTGKFIVIAYPHTSNWDVPFTIAISLVNRLEINWMGKSTLFWGPMGWLMGWLGGIPIKLDQSENTVERFIDIFNRADRLILIIAPEANRSWVDSWKTGFYHIACGANLPIVLGYLDFSRKQGGYLKSYLAAGDIESDLATIQAEYRGIKGLYPDQSI